MKAEELLKRYIAFADMDKDSPALRKRANALIRATREFQRDDVESHPAGSLSEKEALSWHESLRGSLDVMASGKPLGTQATRMSACFKNGEGVRLTTDYADSLSGTTLTLFFAMREAGVKAIVRCPGCDCIFPRIKGRRKTCSDRCRKRKSDADIRKQKEAVTKKRMARYKK